jgi:RyR domain
VLHAFLTVPHFVHGSRSIEAILDMCRLTQQRRFTASCLPTPDQLAEHVSDVDDFMDRVRAERLPAELREELGELIHQEYRSMRRRLCRTGDDLDNDPAMLPWCGLRADLRESNRQQGDATPRRLRQFDMYMAKYDPDEDELEVKEFTHEQIEKLAEMEHERYVAERLTAGWQQGPRNAANSTTPFLVPWCDVSAYYKEYDRESIRNLPRLLKAVGYRVYRKPDPD